MKDLLTYIICIWTGRNIIHTKSLQTKYSIEQIYDKISEYKPNHKLDTISFKFNDGLISIEEVFDSGLRWRTPPKLSFNRAYTNLHKIEDNLIITIEIERPEKSRVNFSATLILLVMSFICLIYTIYSHFYVNKNSANVLLSACLMIFFLIAIILMWKVYDLKHQKIIHLLEDVLQNK